MLRMTNTSARLCNPPEALSWKEIGLPPRRVCFLLAPIEVGVLSSYKIKNKKSGPNLFNFQCSVLQVGNIG